MKGLFMPVRLLAGVILRQRGARAWLVLGAALVLVTLGGVAVRGWLRNGRAEEVQALRPVRGPIRMTIECNGRVVSHLDVAIKCKASGQITAVPYDVSDVVTQGALLVELDPVDETRRVRQAAVRTASAQAKLAQARQELTMAVAQLTQNELRAGSDLASARVRAKDARAKAERLTTLLQEDQVSEELTETAHTVAAVAAAALTNALVGMEELKIARDALEVRRQDVALAEAQLRSDEIDHEITQQRLKETKVFAPMDGAIAARNVQIGQIISSPMSSVGEGTTLMMLSDLSRMYVLASVDESDIGRIQVGQRAMVSTDSFPGDELTGIVTRIATAGSSVAEVVTFEVKVEVVDERKQKLRPEMTANVSVLAAALQNALLLPTEAVVRKRGRVYALVQTPGGVEQREIEVGIEDGTEVEIVRGLDERDMVVLPGSAAQSRWAKLRAEHSERMRGRMTGGGGF
ncbi:MAG: efflux RND transporter periplasmic adaptor subunit [bacterium]|nr:efflux RND transporter periplasmic adaptor subunit [bacterium]